MLLAGACAPKASERNALRAPAYPLVSIDPYTSAWSMTDNLYDSPVRHWTGKDFPLVGAIIVDGEAYRFMGLEQVDLEPLVALSALQPWNGRYTFSEPSADWTSPAFNDSRWSEGPAPFGTMGRRRRMAGTEWTSEYIWVRRTIDIDAEALKGRLHILFSNDDIADYYVNGVLIHHEGRPCRGESAPFPDEAMAALKEGPNVFAARCHNTGGLAELDFGLMLQKNTETLYSRTAEQLYADVQPTRTLYGFQCGPVKLDLTFTAPLLLDDLELVSRPVNYISYKVTSDDGAAHEVSVHFEASPRWAVDNIFQKTESSMEDGKKLVYLKAGTLSQEILAKRGDDRRIDWGWFYLASEKNGTEASVREEDGWLLLDRALGNTASAEGKIMIGYDDVYSIQYFGENLRPYWNRSGKKTIKDCFEAALKDYPKLVKKCEAFDAKMMSDAEKAGGRKYAELCALAYRQSIHAHKLVESPQGDLLWLSKENNSNGSIGTVDVTYPSAPLFLLYNPKLAEGLMNHIYYYAESGKWTKPFPSHDVGTYPQANGQTYGGDMPVEEAGNMITLTAAACHYSGKADYAAKHWETLTKWTEYLLQFGLDPENQLCTDDFAGHFAHNVNLSVKAILGVASYGYMAQMLGKKEVAEKYTSAAREMAAEWVKMASDGDHYRLVFDKPGTWSQKYNLVWDKLLDLNIFPADVRSTEIAWYLGHQNEYGLPLDNRKTYTKSDWVMWTATLADEKADFEALIEPMWKFYDETDDRVPMSDWIFTDSNHYRGFKARSVVGGYFIKLLEYYN